MGTRSITNVIDDEGNVYVSLYRQYDGYPSGHGAELAEFLQDAHIGNGIGVNPPAGFFNGVGDLAARLVTYFKGNHRDIGSFYLVPPADGEDNTQEFNYTVKGRNPWNARVNDLGADPIGDVTIKVEGYSGVLFQGTVEEFTVWIKRNEEEF